LKIAKEATEQSRGIQIPTIAWCDNVKEVCKGKRVLVFDIPPTPNRHSEERGGALAEPNDEETLYKKEQIGII
jgi:16S rRNA U1498 N3-methylase RsmE